MTSSDWVYQGFTSQESLFCVPNVPTRCKHCTQKVPIIWRSADEPKRWTDSQNKRQTKKNRRASQCPSTAVAQAPGAVLLHVQTPAAQVPGELPRRVRTPAAQEPARQGSPENDAGRPGARRASSSTRAAAPTVGRASAKLVSSTQASNKTRGAASCAASGRIKGCASRNSN